MAHALPRGARCSEAIGMDLRLQRPSPGIEIGPIEHETPGQTEEREIIAYQHAMRRGPRCGPRGFSKKRSITAKRLAATAFVFDVRIVELEAFVQSFALEVKFGAVDVRQALRVDENLDAVRYEDLVFRCALIDIFQLVGQAGTAGRLHAQAHADALAALAEVAADVCAAFSVSVIAILSNSS